MAKIPPDERFLHGRGDLESAATAVRSLQWTPENEVLPRPVLSVHDLTLVLNRALAGEVSISSLERWADAIEARTDLVEHENQRVADALFELATPEVNGELTRERIEELLTLLAR